MTSARHQLAIAIGIRVRAAREAANLTQEDVAARCGKSSGFYGRIERGHAIPSLETLQHIGQSIGTPLWLLLPDADPPPVATPAGDTLVPRDPSDIRRIVRRIRRLPKAQRRMVSRLVQLLEDCPPATAAESPSR